MPGLRSKGYNRAEATIELEPQHPGSHLSASNDDLRATGTSPLSPYSGLDTDRADREARRDFREVNEVHLSKKLAQTFQEMKKSFRLRYVVSLRADASSDQGRSEVSQWLGFQRSSEEEVSHTTGRSSDDPCAGSRLANLLAYARQL